VNSLLDKLPTILVLFVLVGIFLSLRKHAPSARIRLWTYAWALIFLHFFIQAFETHTGTLENILESIDIGSLELSGVVFVVSMTLAVEDRRKRLMMLAVLAVPTAFHAVAAVFGLIYGGVMPLYAVIAREYFPMRIMGTVFGAAAVFSSLGMALGPAVGGRDRCIACPARRAFLERGEARTAGRPHRLAAVRGIQTPLRAGGPQGACLR